MVDEKSNQTKSFNLTELTRAAQQLVFDLDQHTTARGHLWQLATAPCDISPIIAISKPGLSKTGEAEMLPLFNIHLHHLDGDVRELLLAAFIEHEERLAISCWEKLRDVCTMAQNIIDKMRKQRAEEFVQGSLPTEDAQGEPQENNFPPILPLPPR